MKKLLFSLLALVAMIGTISAQRAWAYDLGLGYASDTYTFSFKATTAANATLIFTDAEGTELATHDAGAVVAGKFEDNCVIAGNPAKVIKKLKVRG